MSYLRGLNIMQSNSISKKNHYNKIWKQFNVEKPIQKHNYKGTSGFGEKKNIKNSRDFMLAEFRSNQTEI